MDPKLKNLIAFLVLMQGNGGIATKAPGYIKEKFEQYTGVPVSTIDGTDEQAGWLDSLNHGIYDAYLIDYAG